MLVVEGKSLGWIQVAEKDPAPAIGHSNLHLLVHCAVCCTKTSGESVLLVINLPVQCGGVRHAALQ